MKSLLNPSRRPHVLRNTFAYHTRHQRGLELGLEKDLTMEHLQLPSSLRAVPEFE